jgi:Protein of unknown function (DUF2975)
MDQTSPATAAAARPSRPSPLVQAMCVLGALGLLSIPLSLAFSGTAMDSLGLAAWLGVQADGLAAAARARAALVSVLSVSVGLFVLAQVWRLFARYRRGDVLSAGTARVFAAFAWGVVAMALMHIVGSALMSVALSWDNPPGQRELRVGIEWKDYLLLLLGAVLVAVARVMVRAAALEEENRTFV